jgi:hypothetical protein
MCAFRFRCQLPHVEQSENKAQLQQPKHAIGGSIHGDLFQDTVALDDVFSEQVDGLEWPLLASDGDTAALLQLVSEEQVRRLHCRSVTPTRTHRSISS